MNNYEEKYKKALAWAKSAIQAGAEGMLKEDLEHIFPELTESDDEKIRKALVEMVHDTTGDSLWIDYNVHKEDALDWLEKKSEQKIPKFKTGDFIQYKGMGHNRYTINEVCGTTHYINSQGKRMDMSYTDANFELVEQKPVVIPKFRVGDFVKYANYHGDPIYEIVDMDSECYICEYRGNKYMGDKSVMHFCFDNPYLRLVEQKPVEWSEEDEGMYARIVRSYTSYESRILDARDLSEDNRNNILKDLNEQELWIKEGISYESKRTREIIC